MKVRNSSLSRSIGLILLAMSAGNAFAQEQQTESRASEAATLDTISVTALKRTTNLQETPLAISAVDGETIKQMGAVSFQDYFRTVPSLQIQGDSPSSRRVTVRGIRATGEPTVGVYYDETPLSGPAGTSQDASGTVADMDLFDVQQVEVLRGPQGTLYGSGSMGGTIRMIYNKPDSTAYEGAFDLDFSKTKDAGDPSIQAKAMVNVPLKEDIFAARAVVYKSERAGYIDNTVLYNGMGKEDVNDLNSKGGRFMLRLTPSEAITLDVSTIYQRTEQLGGNSWKLGDGEYNSDNEMEETTFDDMNLFNATLKWDLGFAEWTTAASYYKWELLRNGDYTSTLRGLRTNATRCMNYHNREFGANITVDDCAAGSSYMTEYTAYADSRLPSTLRQPMTLRSRNYESRLSGLSFNDKLAWTVGIYHEIRNDNVESTVALGNPVTGKSVSGYTSVPYTNETFAYDLSAWRHVGTDLTQTAFFGEATWSATDKLDLTYGIRRYDYDKMVYGQVWLSNYITASYAGDYTEVDASASGFLHKFNASYKFTPEIMGYVTAGSGFRPGGINNVPGLPKELEAYQPDEVWNYETGVKTEFWDNRAQVNVSLYQIDWDNMQVSGRYGVSGSGGSAFGYIGNAGAARIRGLELEGLVRPIPGLTINAMATYLDAKLVEDQFNPQMQETTTTGHAGDRLQYVPEFSGAAGVSYNWPIADSGYYGMARFDLAFVGKSYTYFDPADPNNDVVGDYTTVNLRTGIESSGSWSLYLYVNNLLDKAGIITSSSTTADPDEVMTLRPRTVGVTLRMNFR
ncbi:TonB-dependent receptor [Pseudoxanthomonas kalamensis DSM 18571]|uniref:TonB-dependent receptor n=1 Tax=Pseudoxanthomonas kalamensis TaxID=289483 RepID=UPI0013913FEF|nr:TonB-dependent receptor [Pseudoxanthomonas kalamensis]KAF1710313.1 TonB-dependent receptor [Pseudoxanthomonas kalamensis DSM 18571]